MKQGKVDIFNKSTQVGRVRFNDESSTIYIETTPGGYVYDISVKRMRTAPQTLDWIHQVCVAKTWGRDITHDLLCIIYWHAIPKSMWTWKA